MSEQEKVEEKVEMPLYMICESKQLYFQQTVSIMDLKLDELIFEKMFILFEKLQPAQKKYETLKVELQNKKDKLSLETDFKEVLNESRPTVAMKEAYIKKFVADIEEKIDNKNDVIIFYKNKLAVINDLIKAKRLQLQIEGALIEQ